MIPARDVAQTSLQLRLGERCLAQIAEFEPMRNGNVVNKEAALSGNACLVTFALRHQGYRATILQANDS